MNGYTGVLYSRDAYVSPSGCTAGANGRTSYEHIMEHECRVYGVGNYPLVVGHVGAPVSCDVETCLEMTSKSFSWRSMGDCFVPF